MLSTPFRISSSESCNGRGRLLGGIRRNRFFIFYDVVGMFAEVAPLYLQSLGIGSYDTAVVQGVILRLWGTGMERACGAAFLQCRFINRLGMSARDIMPLKVKVSTKMPKKIPLT